MRLPRSRSLVLAVPLVAASAAARAAPQLQLEQCVGLDRGELARAIDEELASTLPAGDADDLTISASCDDGVSATVRISERGSKRRAERALTLGEVTSELRPRLVALVAVELAESVLAAPPAPAVAAEPEGAALELRPSPPEASPPPPAPAPPPGLSSTLTLTSRAPRPIALSLGLGFRTYVKNPDPLYQLTLELDLPLITFGVVGGRSSSFRRQLDFDTNREQLIPYSAYLGGVSVRGELFCIRGEEREVCFEVHGEAGLTRVYASNVDRFLTREDQRGQYLLAGIVAEAHAPLGPLEAALRLELGASDGDDIGSDEDGYISAFSGAVVIANLGLRWRP